MSLYLTMLDRPSRVTYRRVCISTEERSCSHTSNPIVTTCHILNIFAGFQWDEENREIESSIISLNTFQLPLVSPHLCNFTKQK